jgi:hypothetical protein
MTLQLQRLLRLDTQASGGQDDFSIASWWMAMVMTL